MQMQYELKPEEFDGCCPFCACGEFLSGPEGAGSINFKCALCGATFNDMYIHGVQIIGWPEKKPREIMALRE
jgi:hypothetical protein